MKNVTVTLDGETLSRARVRAAERNMSLSRFVGEVLRTALRHDDAYEAAYRSWRAAKPFPLKGPAQRYPKREELYDRPVLSGLCRERIGRTSMQVISEFYAVATRKLSPPVAPELTWEDVDRYLAWRPQPVDEVLLRRAREVESRYRLSWWDSMIVAAGERAG